jgi:hypothetical protein
MVCVAAAATASAAIATIELHPVQWVLHPGFNGCRNCGSLLADQLAAHHLRTQVHKVAV